MQPNYSTWYENLMIHFQIWVSLISITEQLFNMLVFIILTISPVVRWLDRMAALFVAFNAFLHICASTWSLALMSLILSLSLFVPPLHVTSHLFFKNIIFILCVPMFCLYVYVYTVLAGSHGDQKHWIPRKQRLNMFVSRYVFVCWESNPDSLKGQPLFLTTEPSLHPLPLSSSRFPCTLGWLKCTI